MKLLVCALGVGVMLCAGCGDPPESPAPGTPGPPGTPGSKGGSSEESGGGKVKVVATIWPLASVAREMGGDAVEVACLLPGGVSPHFAPDSAKMMAAVRGADLIIANGSGLDHWVLSAARAAGRDEAEIFWVSKHVEGECDHETDADAHEGHGHRGHGHDDHGHGHDDHGHGHGGVDPHYWLDPVLMGEVCGHLEAEMGALIGERGGDVAALRARAAELREKIEALDGEFRERFGGLEGAKVVTFHDAFGRMAERYGVEVAATLRPMGGLGDVTPDRIAEVIGVIERYELKAVFGEPQFSPEAARLVEQKTGARVLVLDPLGHPMEADRSGYVDLMRYNLETMLKGITGP